MILNMGSIATTIVDYLGKCYIPVSTVFKWIVLFLSLFNVHRLVFFVLGFFFTRKFPPAKQYHKYAILIPARNEATVIANLLKSIEKQDYPKEYLTIFVVADNCTDNTAEIVRANGAVCYEHQNPDERTKGYALKYLFEQIEKDYGIKSFEGYFIFDADNLLNRDYISRMNDSFDAGEKIITSYRNSKNFDENWMSASYALHWIRSSRTRHRARSLLRLATNIQGTG
ncbi:MAG: glycosyltransferase, partial [Lachnospiraceae bacterium]|nr:glycosyltransferase [Lachnospiraceae bacterium]